MGAGGSKKGASPSASPGVPLGASTSDLSAGTPTQSTPDPTASGLRKPSVTPMEKPEGNVGASGPAKITVMSISRLDSDKNIGLKLDKEDNERSASGTKLEQENALPMITKRMTAGANPGDFIHDVYQDQFQEAKYDGNKVYLPRGGILVRTGSADSIDIQFGIPPETIKDSMKLGFKIPSYFVITKEMFDRVTGTSLAEFEFPAYFNFFVLKKPVTIICQHIWTNAIKDIFTETLLGPAEHLQYLDEDYAEGVDEGSKPNWKGEGEYLDAARKTMKVEDLLNIVEFNPAGIARIPNSHVSIKFDSVDQVYNVYTNDNNNKELVATIQEDYKALPVKSEKDEKKKDKKLEYRPLSIPQFGVTVLGASHGFDPSGTTTGFVIWVNGRGMMVDPPPGSTQVLEKLSIPSRMIEGVILTHCHADHDAGTFQRILKEQNVMLYTTKTIYESFIRKYSAMTGFDQRFLSRCVTHYPCQVGVPIPFHGAYFKIFYSMHTIPCIGFEVICGDRSIVYSADTNADPELPLKMLTDKVIGKGRQKALSKNALNGDHTLIFHEAGVPPIHTPMELLAAQPDSVKERMYLVHVSSNKVPTDANLKVANEWTTLEISGQDLTNDERQNLEIKQCLISTEFFMNVENKNFDAITSATTKVKIPPNTCIYKQGDKITKIYYVIAGSVEGRREKSTERTGEEMMHTPHLFAAGDIIGQQGIVSEGEDAAFSVTTTTTTYMFEINLAVVKKVLTNAKELQVLENLAILMKTNTWNALAANSILQRLTMMQCVSFAAFLGEEVIYEAGEEIDCEQCGFLVTEGTLHVLLDTTQGNEESDDDDEEEEEEEEKEKGEATLPGSIELGEVAETVKLLAGNIDVEIRKDSVAGQNNASVRVSATTFRGQHARVSFIDEECIPGTMVLDANAFIMNTVSEVQVEAMTRCAIRKFERDKTLAFMHHNPGLMMRLIDSIMSNLESTFY